MAASRSGHFDHRAQIDYIFDVAKPVRPTPPERPEMQPTHVLSADAFTGEELARMDQLAPVGVADALAWLRGEGPDPWPDGSR